MNFNLKSAKIKRVLRRTMVFLIGILTLILVILKFPQFLFIHQAESKSIVVYSTQPIPNSVYPLMDRAIEKLRDSEFYSEDLSHKVFLCNSRMLYVLLSYPSKTTFAGNNVLTGNIIVAEADIDSNLSYRSKDERTRDLDNLIVHEIVHTFLFTQLGVKKYFNLPAWKNEGYCDYIAGASTVSSAEEITMICNDQNPGNYSYYRIAIEYLIREKGLSIDEIISGNFNYRALIDSAKLKHCFREILP